MNAQIAAMVQDAGRIPGHTIINQNQADILIVGGGLGKILPTQHL